MTRRPIIGMFVLAAALGLWSCEGCDEGSRAGPCNGEVPIEGCGQSCAGSTPCPDGLYCSEDAVCTADCSVDHPCGDGRRCNEHGLCVADPDGGGGDADSDADRDADEVEIDGDWCADVRVETARVTPTVVLLIDQSSSMTEWFSRSGNRWDVLRDSLLDAPGGLIFELESQVRFGLALYSAVSEHGGSGGPPIGECPMLTTVAPAIDNYEAIREVYEPARVIEDTPTGDAVDAVLDLFFSAPSEDPAVIVIATDGEPDRCEELDPQRGQAEAVAAVERAYDLGIRTFMISVGEGTVSAEHMQDMANAGTGEDGAPYWVAGDDEGLRGALTAIIGGELSCEITLNGELVLEIACEGTVLLNGRPLACDDPDGWRAVDRNHIELQGDACDELQGTPDAVLEATFPCEAVTLY